MKSTFVMTVMGPESLGIIKALAHTTHELGGTWDRSKVAKLEGRFAAIIKVAIEADRVAELKAAFEKEFASFTFTYAEPLAEGETATKNISLEVDCKDRAGIIKDIHNLMLNLNLKVVNMDSHRYEVAEIGAAVFSAKLNLEVPENTSAESVVDEIETLYENMRVTVL